MPSLILPLSVLVFASSSFASIEWGQARATGTGCGSQTVQVTADQSRISVDFDAFKGVERATCLIALPAKWPKDKVLVVKNLKSRGRNEVGGKLGLEIFAPGKRGTPQSIEVSKSVMGELFRSNCGEGGMLRVNSSLENASLDQLEADLTLEAYP